MSRCKRCRRDPRTPILRPPARTRTPRGRVGGWRCIAPWPRRHRARPGADVNRCRTRTRSHSCQWLKHGRSSLPCEGRPCACFRRTAGSKVEGCGTPRPSPFAVRHLCLSAGRTYPYRGNADGFTARKTMRAGRPDAARQSPRGIRPAVLSAHFVAIPPNCDNYTFDMTRSVALLQRAQSKRRAQSALMMGARHDRQQERPHGRSETNQAEGNEAETEARR
jgi:hypothetical protein